MVPGSLSSSRQHAVEAALADLEPLLGSRVTTNAVEREHHSHGESYHLPALPDIVCFPQSTAEVSEIMKISARHQIPVVPFGAGTSVEGHVNALRGGITIDLREMNHATARSRSCSARAASMRPSLSQSWIWASVRRMPVPEA